MFIGHFAAAYTIIYLFPTVPPLIPLIGVSFPDLLWPFLILSGAEKVTIDPEAPLQKAIALTRYPYSHSLLIGTLIASIPGAIIAFTGFGRFHSPCKLCDQQRNLRMNWRDSRDPFHHTPCMLK